MPKRDGSPTKGELRMRQRADDERDRLERSALVGGHGLEHLEGHQPRPAKPRRVARTKDATPEARAEAERARRAERENARAGRDSCQTPPGSPLKKSLPPNALDFPISPIVSDAVASSDAGLSPSDVGGGSDACYIRWAMEHLHDLSCVREVAPSATAWALLCWARRDPKAEDAFVTQVYGKAFVSKDEEDSKRRDRRSRSNIETMIARCMEAATDQNGESV